MIGFALLGAGRIGKMHAGYIAANPRAELLYVYDLFAEAAGDAAAQYGAQVAQSVEQVLDDSRVKAVLIATNTDTHVDLITQAVQAGKAVFCEKPIDLDCERVAHCWEAIKDYDVPVQIGFNRRFDPGHRALQQAVAAGEVGSLEQLLITSRDPGLPPLEYLKVSGGLFRDMAIHDFDIARFILGEEPVEIQVLGAALVDPQLAEIGDIDSAMIQMKTASGRLVHINCSRRACYGYDQRIEALGAKGMLLSDNPRSHGLVRSDSRVTDAREPLHHFFIERYREAYEAQLNAFVNSLAEGTPVSPSFEDGYRAQRLADAAKRALESGQPVKIDS